MRSLDIEVTSVVIRATLGGDGRPIVTAPPGTSFVVLNATVLNRTGISQVFESSAGTISGRQTALWLYSQNHHVLPYHGPDGADYSVQCAPALGAIDKPLAGATLLPAIAYQGELVFSYPNASLRSHPVAVLDIQEFREGFGGTSSIGGVRMRL